MSEIIFGTIWTLFVAMITFVSYADTGTTITVNGTIVSQEEFSAMLGPKIFLAIFWLIGLSMIAYGIYKTKKAKDIENYGEVCYGRITKVYFSGTYKNDEPLYKANIDIYIFSTKENKTVSGDIGFDKYLYPENSYVEVKYYKDNITVQRPIESEDIPLYAAEHIINTENDAIIIDGVEYVRKSSYKNYL